MNSIELAILGIIIGTVLALVGFILNLLLFPDVIRFFGYAGDATIKADARALSVAYIVETITRTIGKVLFLIVMALIAARLAGILDATIGVLAIFLLDAALLFFDIATLVTVLARRFVRKVNESEGEKEWKASK